MQKKYILSILFFSFIYLLNETMAQSTDRESAGSSVVKIKTTYPAATKGKHGVATATGWCWKDPTLVITALHAVTGASKIMVSKTESVKCEAKIEKVLKEADLVLLRLTRDLGLVPLRLQTADPNSTLEYFVWGFPEGAYSMAGDDIRFSRSLEATPTLNSILTGNKLKNELETQGYPLPGARILRISSTIQPGHSGAPIMARDGTVIGVADGGLRGGTARINWAMPASYYVPRLSTSNDLVPKTPSVQVELYSSLTEVDDDATEEEENSEYVREEVQNTIVNGEMSISKTWTASYDEITGTLSEKDIIDLATLTTAFGIDMSDTEYDIYEDYTTGATITAPAGEYFTVQNGWFYSGNADASLLYDALPFMAGTYGEAKNNAYLVYQQNFPADEWVSDPATPDVVDEDDEIEMASYEITRTAADGSGRMLYYCVEVDGPDLLVTFMLYNQLMLLDPDYLKKFLHYAVAMEMATFAEN
jgi:S1-C subfamily serine protease